MPTEFFALGFAQQMHSEGEGMDPDEKWKRELSRWEKVSPAISKVHCKKGSIFQVSVEKFPYLRRRIPYGVRGIFLPTPTAFFPLDRPGSLTSAGTGFFP